MPISIALSFPEKQKNHGSVPWEQFGCDRPNRKKLRASLFSKHRQMPCEHRSQGDNRRIELKKDQSACLFPFPDFVPLFNGIIHPSRSPVKQK
ncbi:MAG: hypothetical protein IJO10_06320 [Clostridia bacterium]|nr:hypothetical protein [Clostridia bacterium]